MQPFSLSHSIFYLLNGMFAAFVGKLSFADVVKSPAPPVRVLMSRENLPTYQPTSRYTMFANSVTSCNNFAMAPPVSLN